MASRRTRRTSRTAPYDPDKIENWTRTQLITKLGEQGIKITGSLPATELRRLYLDNFSEGVRAIDGTAAQSVSRTETVPQPLSAHARPDTTAAPLAVTSEALTVPDPPSARARSPTATASDSSELLVMANVMNSLQTSVAGLQQTVTALMTRQSADDSFTTGGATSVNLLGSQGMASEDLPTVDVVSPSLRRNIVEGKDVNLAALLIPDYEMSQDKTVVTSGVEFRVKPQADPRLSKNLSISEFITAYGKYKRVMCSKYPNRRDELEAYEAGIVEMSNIFGPKFYEYHKLFSAKAAAAMTHLRVKVDWSKRDRDLFMMVIGGTQSNSCDNCKSIAHATDFCPRMTAMTFSAPARETTASVRDTPAYGVKDKYGRQISFFDGKSVCNNFNSDAGCYRGNCRRLHSCITCNSLQHGAAACQTNKARRPRNYTPFKKM